MGSQARPYLIALVFFVVFWLRELSLPEPQQGIAPSRLLCSLALAAIIFAAAYFVGYIALPLSLTAHRRLRSSPSLWPSLLAGKDLCLRDAGLPILGAVRDHGCQRNYAESPCALQTPIFSSFPAGRIPDRISWQSRWTRALKPAQRIEQDNWLEPERDAWVGRIIESIVASTRPVVLVAHSLGVAAVAHAGQRMPKGFLTGAFLVAPADVDNAAS